MARLEKSQANLQVRFTLAEQIGGLIRDFEVPLASVVEVAVEPDALGAVSGLRAPGFALPGSRKVGTWRGRGRKVAVSVSAGQPALRLVLKDHRYDEVLVGIDEADQVAGELRSSIS